MSASLEEIIRGRRSIGRVKDEPVPKEQIEKLIEAAVWAPNHFGTEPWKFIVMTGEGRRVLGQAYADIAEESVQIQELPEEERKLRLEKEVAKAYRSPVVIAAVCVPSDNPRALLAEELAAAHSSVQNLLLTAHANGLGAVWRTGDPAYHPKVKQAFGFEGNEQVIGLIYIGYPDMDQPVGKRTPAAEKTVWLEG
ncbi:nitroreductase family protein [Cohnella abietis]|uniref:Putative NAD(P)H nitroreductase n=1 Tax=Cohnella abietis TaxID=2507935 RepID=A0A3T1D4L8_9BACL|nr:nitroreductase [Cohnella abietis]BBI33011.1 putative NAD(P)H nitroreductase YfhC [Cohnella abietis]